MSLLHEDPDAYRSAGMCLLLDLLEEWANNDGKLAEPAGYLDRYPDGFFGTPDPITGYDGIDELTDSVMGIMAYEYNQEVQGGDWPRS